MLIKIHKTMKKMDPNESHNFGEQGANYTGKSELLGPMLGYIPLAGAMGLVIFSGEEEIVFSPLRILIFGGLFLAGIYYILYSYNSFRIEGRTIFVNHQFRFGGPLEKSFDDIKLVFHDYNENALARQGSNFFIRVHFHDGTKIKLPIRKKTIWRWRNKDHREEILSYFENHEVKVVRR